MSERDAVKQFHAAMGILVRERPTMPSEAERLLRCRLLLEETLEYIRASGFSVAVSLPEADAVVSATTARFMPDYTPDLAAMAQENADVRYIAHGNDLTMGAPPGVFAEVHAANMTKLDENGQPVRRADGKVIKGPNYRPPDVAKVLAEWEG